MCTYHTVSYTPLGKAESVTIEYLDEGVGRVIVMLPSLARSGRDYDEVAALITAKGYRVIRPEPRGVLGSRGPLEHLSLHDFGGDVAAVLDHEQVQSVLMVGHAWGSQPARIVAANRPDLVCALVLAAASAGKLLPGSTEKPYSRMRAQIDGAGDANLSKEDRQSVYERHFLHPEMIRVSGFRGGIQQHIMHKVMPEFIRRLMIILQGGV